MRRNVSSSVSAWRPRDRWSAPASANAAMSPATWSLLPVNSRLFPFALTVDPSSLYQPAEYDSENVVRGPPGFCRVPADHFHPLLDLVDGLHRIPRIVTNGIPRIAKPA